MDVKQEYLLLEGIEAGVALRVDSAFHEALPTIFSHWPYEIVSETAREVFASVEQKENGRYYLTSPYIDSDDSYRDSVNIVCAIVAELAWQRLREDPSLLCIHGAAADFGGRLVVFPATRKAGKSTLSVAMAAAGIRIYTDDFLPISVEDDGVIRGISSGVSPRLRLPLPDQLGDNAVQYMARRQLISNKQYTYIEPLLTETAAFGESLPLGGMVFLERKDGAKAEMAKITTAEALKILIYQNFSRAGNAGDILAMLEFVTLNMPSYLLRYDHAEPAVDLLKERFSGWENALPRFHPRAKLVNESEQGMRPFDLYTEVEIGQFEHADGVQTVSTDGQRFLTGRNGQSIHYLNEGAALIWQILREPTSVDEAIEILRAAFPEQTQTQIETDVLRCFKDFGKNGLLKKIETGMDQAPQNAELSAP